jgi:hypothetical protein
MPIAPEEHDGITGVTFTSNGHRRLVNRARQPCRYAEIDGAGHDFAWQRSRLRELVTGWLDEIHL